METHMVVWGFWKSWHEGKPEIFSAFKIRVALLAFKYFCVNALWFEIPTLQIQVEGVIFQRCSNRKSIY